MLILLALLHALNYESPVTTRVPVRLDPDVAWACTKELLIATRYGETGRLQALLAKGTADPAALGNVAVRKAARDGHVGCVHALLADPRVDPAAYSNEAIGLASFFGHVGCVKALLADRRVDPAAKENYAIYAAAMRGNAECVALLLADPRVSPVAYQNWTIHDAARYGHTDCVRLLLADPRVDPSAGSGEDCHPSVRHLVETVQACRDGDLGAFKQVNLAALPCDVLDILASRNRSFPNVLQRLLPHQLTCLAVPETVRDDPIYCGLLRLAVSGGFCGSSQIRELTKTFICMKNTRLLFGEHAAAVVLNSYGLVL